MSANFDFKQRLKEELRSVGALSETGLALLTVKGEIHYSELSSALHHKLELFKPSYPSLAIGSNIILAEENESLIITRISEQMLMALKTPQQQVGSILNISSNLIKKYTNEFEKYAKTVAIDSSIAK
ncbi:MAG: hypothetical protein ACETWM_14705 [Candidatus Lokiarchaeia archaeon]